MVEAMYFGKYLAKDYFLELHLMACFLPVSTPPAHAMLPTLPLANLCHN